MLRSLTAAALAAASIVVHAAEAPPPAPVSPGADVAAMLAPGFERVLLDRGRFLRARIVRHESGLAWLEREDGLRIVALESSVVRVLPADEALPARDAPTGVFLRDGRTLSLRLVARTPSGLLGEDSDGQRIFVRDIRLTRGEDAPLDLSEPLFVPPERGGAGVPALVTTKAGVVLEATLLTPGEDATLLEDGAGRLAVLADAITRLTVAGGVETPALTRQIPWPSDLSSSRGLALPAGALLRPRTVLLAQTGGVTWVEAGVLENLQLSLGTAWPLGYQSGAGWNLLVEAKGGLSLGSHLHLAAGLSASVAETGNILFLFASATFGTRDLYASLYAGPPLAATYAAGAFGDRVVALSGLWRFSRRFAAVTEGWVGLDGGTPFALAASLRFVHARVSADLGLARVPSSDVPMPWVGFSVGIAMPREVTP